MDRINLDVFPGLVATGTVTAGPEHGVAPLGSPFVAVTLAAGSALGMNEVPVVGFGEAGDALAAVEMGDVISCEGTLRVTLAKKTERANHATALARMNVLMIADAVSMVHQRLPPSPGGQL
tara:strand:+ start:5730 stop:6092 length:363 start_codon:yes stop_codon:yes gene_type:complete